LLKHPGETDRRTALTQKVLDFALENNFSKTKGSAYDCVSNLLKLQAKSDLSAEQSFQFLTDVD